MHKQEVIKSLVHDSQHNIQLNALHKLFSSQNTMVQGKVKISLSINFGPMKNTFILPPEKSPPPFYRLNHQTNTQKIHKRQKTGKPIENTKKKNGNTHKHEISSE